MALKRFLRPLLSSIPPGAASIRAFAEREPSSIGSGPNTALAPCPLNPVPSKSRTSTSRWRTAGQNPGTQGSALLGQHPSVLVRGIDFRGGRTAQYRLAVGLSTTPPSNAFGRSHGVVGQGGGPFRVTAACFVDTV